MLEVEISKRFVLCHAVLSRPLQSPTQFGVRRPKCSMLLAQDNKSSHLHIPQYVLYAFVVTSVLGL